MLPIFLIPETIVTENGHSDAIDIRTETGVLQLTLGISQCVEQESLEILIESSGDGTTWVTNPVTTFPQKFYTGTYSQILDLTQHPDVNHLRAVWRVNRWGRGSLSPTFKLYLVAERLA